MIGSDNQMSEDFSLLDLFRSEVKAHGSILRDGISGITRDPDVGSDLDTLISAVKTIYGGARIVDAGDIADLATAIKEYLIALQNKQRQLTPESATDLIEAADMLLDLTAVESSALLAGLEKSRERIRDKIDRITPKKDSQAGPLSDQKVNVPQKGKSEPGQIPHDRINNQVVVKKTDSKVDHKAGHKDEPAKESKPQKADTAILNVDDGMLDLYMEEVRNHTEVLNNGLLTLENNPKDANQLEALMRSAHSLKGGARVVGLPMAVDCAHVLEDCFVAAQRGKIILESDHVDILLKGVDMLISISEAVQNKDVDQLNGLRDENDLLIQQVREICEGTHLPVPPAAKAVPEKDKTPVPEEAKPPKEPDKPAQVQPSRLEVNASANMDKKAENDGTPSPKSKVVDKTRAVRVSAEKIERLMGLAGEVVVGARWLPPFSESLLSIKRSYTDLYNILSRLQDIFHGGNFDDDVQKIVAEARERNKESIQKLADRMTHLEKFTSSYETLSDSIYHEVISVRMRPFSDGVRKFPRLVRDLSRTLDKKVKFEIRGKNTEVDRDILEKLDAPLTHLIQNALDHGIETSDDRLASGKAESGTIILQASHLSGMLIVSVTDDGKGINLDDLRNKIVRKGLSSDVMVGKMGERELLDFLFLPGFSTRGNVTQISGRGVGLDVVHNMVREVGGSIRAESKPGEGMMFILELPLTLSVIRTFLVEISDELYAFPLARIDRCLVLNRRNIETVEDREYFQFNGNNIALVDVHDVLMLEKKQELSDDIMVLVVSDRMNSYGLAVDKFLGETDLVQRPLDYRLGKVPNIDAAAIMLDGSPILIIDVEDTVRSIDKLVNAHRLKKIALEGEQEPGSKKRILVVDDSITVREMERKLLVNMGYDVELAIDGAEGWNVIRSSHFDLIISDIDMPRMNGFELVANIRNHEEIKSIPVIIVSYKDREEDRMRGLEVGANYYLTKSSFEDNTFIDAVIDLIGDS